MHRIKANLKFTIELFHALYSIVFFTMLFVTEGNFKCDFIFTSSIKLLSNKYLFKLPLKQRKYTTEMKYRRLRHFRSMIDSTLRLHNSMRWQFDLTVFGTSLHVMMPIDKIGSGFDDTAIMGFLWSGLEMNLYEKQNLCVRKCRILITYLSVVRNFIL